jgi:hypothetical protein
MHLHASSLPCGWITKGIANLQGKCTLESISDPIDIELVSVCQQSGNRGLPKMLKDTAHLVENKVTDDTRSLKAARCQPSKLSKPLNHKETVTWVSSELRDLGL